VECMQRNTVVKGWQAVKQGSEASVRRQARGHWHDCVLSPGRGVSLHRDLGPGIHRSLGHAATAIIYP
jgi:hypothetical protein